MKTKSDVVTKTCLVLSVQHVKAQDSAEFQIMIKVFLDFSFFNQMKRTLLS